jgi:hypothetical protein
MKMKCTHSATCSCIIERYDYERSCTTFADIFPNWDFLQDFLKIPTISPEGSANAMGEAEGAQRPVFRVNEPEKRGARACSAVITNNCKIKAYIVSGTVEVEEISQGVVEVPWKTSNVRRNVRHLSKNRKNKKKNRNLPNMQRHVIKRICESIPAIVTCFVSALERNL